jgi:hypothetical protein
MDLSMNKAFIGATAITATVIGGYVYYRHNKVQVDKWVQQKQDQALGMLLEFGANRFEKVTEDEVPR